MSLFDSFDNKRFFDKEQHFSTEVKRNDSTYSVEIVTASSGNKVVRVERDGERIVDARLEDALGRGLGQLIAESSAGDGDDVDETVVEVETTDADEADDDDTSDSDESADESGFRFDTEVKDPTERTSTADAVVALTALGVMAYGFKRWCDHITVRTDD